MNVKKTVYPPKQLSQNMWMKKYKVSSRYERPNSKRMYQDGEYDQQKFIKMIKNYGQSKQQQSIWEKINKAFSTLCSWKVQKTWNKINFA